MNMRLYISDLARKSSGELNT